MSQSVWSVQPFDPAKHDRAGFDCGQPVLDRYIRQIAPQDLRRQLARIFVVCRPGSTIVLGYFAISAASFERGALPEAKARKLPAYPVPAAIIGRLAVDRSTQGRRLGEYLLMDALARISAQATAIGIYAVIVEAIDDKAVGFYRRYGFEAFPGDRRRLFLPMVSIAGLFA